MDLFIILTLEEENGIFRQNSSNVVMCCKDVGVLFCSCLSCCNFCLIMEMAGSTGTDMQRASTSYNVMHSPPPQYNGFDVVYEVLRAPDVMREIPYKWPEDFTQLLGYPVCDCIPAG